MYEQTVTIRNSAGLHARPISELVACAKQFTSRAFLQRPGDDSSRVSARSAVMLLSQGFTCGEQIQISASGEDAKACVDALAALIRGGIGEN